MPNYYVAYQDAITKFKAADMNAPFVLVDRALTYLKNVIITCDGSVSFSTATNRLTWSGAIHIYFNGVTGAAIHNQINASYVTLADNYLAYVSLSETDNAVITVTAAAITTGSASNFIAANCLVLAYRNTVDDRIYGELMPLLNRDLAVLKTLFDAQSILMATTDNTPVPLVIGEQTMVGRKTGGTIVALTVAEVLTMLGVDLTAYVPKSLFDANTLLSANTDDTPAAVTIAEQQVVGRITGGNIKGLSIAELRTLLSLTVSTSTPADVDVSGTKLQFTASVGMAFGDVVTIGVTGKMALAKADVIGNAWGLFLCTETLAADAAGNFLLPGGIARNDAWNWTVGSPIYLSVTGTTGNTLTQSMPSGANNVVQIIGVATHADRMFFYPQLVQVEHV